MMRNVSDAVLSLMDLVEAEARLIRRMMLDGFTVMLAMTGAAIAAGGGLILLLLVLHEQVSLHYGSNTATVSVALLCFVLSGAFLWLVKHLKS